MVLSNTTDSRAIIAPDFKLQLRDIEFDEYGMYECVVVNPLGRLSLRNNLSVIGEITLSSNSSYTGHKL